MVGLQVEFLECLDEGVEVWQWSNVPVSVDVPGLSSIGEVASSIACLFSFFNFGKFDVFPDAKNPCSDGGNRGILSVKVRRLGGFRHSCTV